MDDRKKNIDDLEKAKQESQDSLNTILESFGETLYARIKDMPVDFDDIVQYNVYKKDIIDSNSAIAKVEEKNRRFIELEETISSKEHEEKERSKELAVIHRKLGKALLGNEAYNDYTSLYKDQADTLSSKLESLENRIRELEAKGEGNVFTWIGKNAQGLVLRSLLSKAQESQEQLFLNVGENYTDHSSVSLDDSVSVLIGEVGSIRSVSKSVKDEISVLRDEKRMLSAGFGIDGNPQKQIQNLKNHIHSIKNELRILYRNFGAQGCGIMDANIKPERKYFIDTIVTAEDGEVISRVSRFNQSISDYDKAINKLKASLAIDEETAKIEKYIKTINEKKLRITELESGIRDMEENISVSESLIKKYNEKLYD